MRLNRYLAQGTRLSRRGADEAISSGRVRINGHIAQLTTVLEDGQMVTLDGKPIGMPTTHEYILFNKPVGFVCSREKQGGADTIYEILPESFIKLKSVGRLDRQSSGLLLLSDDGDFIHRHMHPSFKKQKRYEVGLSAPLKPEDRLKLTNGVMLDDGISKLGLTNVKGRSVVVTLEEGRNRQIRRSFAVLGYQVVKLHRTNFGPFSLDHLPARGFRSLSPEEAIR